MKNITSQEKRILELISNGHSTAEIAFALSISPHTVESHRKNLLTKLEARNAAELIRKAIQLKILEISAS